MINASPCGGRGGLFFGTFPTGFMAYFRHLHLLTSGALLLAAAGVQPAFAQASAQTPAGAGTNVTERAGIQTTGQVIFQDIAVTPSLTVAPTIDSTSNSQITVLGQGGDAVSLAVPDAINMTKTDGQQTLTVVTNADGSYAVPILPGVLSPDGVLSVNVGGTLQTASQPLQPGQYRGVLVVVAQYN